MYLCHVVGGLSLRDVAREFERDRTTVGYACHAIEDKRDEEVFDQQLNLLECELRKRVKEISDAELFPFPGLERKSFKFAVQRCLASWRVWLLLRLLERRQEQILELLRGNRH